MSESGLRGAKVSKGGDGRLHLQGDEFHPVCNYTIAPRAPQHPYEALICAYRLRSFGPNPTSEELVRGDRSARPRRQRPAGCITRLTRRVRDLLTVDPHGAAGPVEGHHIARDRHDPLHDEAELGFHALALAIEPCFRIRGAGIRSVTLQQSSLLSADSTAAP